MPSIYHGIMYYDFIDKNKSSCLIPTRLITLLTYYFGQLEFYTGKI
jgi:hypothetical protein